MNELILISLFFATSKCVASTHPADTEQFVFILLISNIQLCFGLYQLQGLEVFVSVAAKCPTFFTS